MEARIPKLVLKKIEIETKNFNIDCTECYECNGNLFYIAEEFGIAYEGDYKVSGYVFKKGSLSLTNVGMTLFCAECGSHNEGYNKWMFDDDKIVHSWDRDDLDADDKDMIEVFLSKLNKTGKVNGKGYYYVIDDEVKKKIEKWFEKNKNLLEKREVKKKKQKV